MISTQPAVLRTYLGYAAGVLLALLLWLVHRQFAQRLRWA